MMYALVDGRAVLARPDGRGRCTICGAEVTATCGTIRIWHWIHEGPDCDAWSEPESAWHLAWKKHAPADRAEVVIDRDGGKHRADVLCLNSAVLELQSGAISADDVVARESFYKYMAWLFRVTWTDQLHYGDRGFWWKSPPAWCWRINKPVFWDFEQDGIVQEIKLAVVDVTDRRDRRIGDRIVGRAVKTYRRDQFAEFIATGKVAA